MKNIKTFEVKHLQVIDEEGRADAELMPEISDELLKKFFETIILARIYNQRALSLQREGRLGTYASVKGQEASQIGSALALGKDDWVFPSFRESGVYIALGYPAWLLYRYWRGDERGMKGPEGLNIFPMSVPVGTHIPHATGTALAMKYRKADAAAVAYFGDGGSSRGDFHESLNIAGVFGAPVVYLCQNNQYAISLPREKQTAAETIAQRAHSYGFEGVQVDGNDIVAVYKATKEALEKARGGGGPTLIECFTYRLDDHTTADDASRYRTTDEVKAWEKKEPLIRLRKFMEEKGLWSEDYEKEVSSKAQEKIDQEIKEFEEYGAPDPADIIKYTYGELTPRQVRELKERGWQK